MRTRHFAIAAGLLVLGACDFDILNTNQPTLGDLLSNPTRDKLAAAATGLMSSARTGMESLIWRLGSMGREGINLSGNNQPDYAEPFFGPVQGGGSFGGTQWLDRYQSIRTANIYLQALANNVGLSGPDSLSPAELAASRGKANVLRATALNGCHGTPATCYTAALAALGQTFLSTAPADFQAGAYLDFSTDGGDQTNGLSEPLDGSTYFALPSDTADAETQAG